MNARGLLLSKAMVDLGERTLRAQGAFDSSMALLLLHDALESALTVTATQHGDPSVKLGAFADFWKSIPNLPMKVEMDRLNRARADLKHHLNNPDRDDVEDHFRNARALLSKVASSYFGLDYDTLSQVQLVADKQVREHLSNAERELLESRIREALIECSRARDLLQEQQSELYSQPWLVSYGISEGMSVNVDKRIRAEVQHLQQLIRDLSGVMFAQTFGLNLVEHHFLRGVLPQIRGTEITFSAGVPEGITSAMVGRCIELLARYAIRLNRELSAANHPDWNPPK